MTILGRHTVAETRALARAVDYQFKQVDNEYKAISREWITNNQAGYDKLTADWTKALREWNIDWEKAKVKLDILMAAAGLTVPEDIVPSEEQYNKVLSHTAQGGRNGDDSLYMVARRVEEINNRKVDYSKQPSQIDVWDPDLGAYKKVDAAIKTGEAGAKKVASSKTGLLIGGGIAAIVATVVVTKVYL